MCHGITQNPQHKIVQSKPWGPFPFWCVVWVILFVCWSAMCIEDRSGYWEGCWDALHSSSWLLHLLWLWRCAVCHWNSHLRWPKSCIRVQLSPSSVRGADVMYGILSFSACGEDTRPSGGWQKDSPTFCKCANCFIDSTTELAPWPIHWSTPPDTSNIQSTQSPWHYGLSHRSNSHLDMRFHQGLWFYTQPKQWTSINK